MRGNTSAKHLWITMGCSDKELEMSFWYEDLFVEEL